MSYAKINKDGTFEEISCTKAEAVKQGFKQLPDNFKHSQYHPRKVSSYKDDFTLKTDDELVADNLIEDNRGDYYSKTSGRRTTIYTLDTKPLESFTDKKPLDNPCKWDKTKWIEDTEEIERQEQAQIKGDLINSDMRMIRKIEDYLKTKQDLPEILTEEISVRETLRTKIKK